MTLGLLPSSIINTCDIVPYRFDNVLIRYTGHNDATGYVAGVDLRLAGELVGFGVIT